MGAWGKITVVLMMALIPSPLQCFISCAARVNQAAAPGAAPCHHSPKGSGSRTAPCSQGTVVNAHRLAPLQLGIASPAAAFLPVAVDVGLSVVARRGDRLASDSPPRGCALFVLRI